MFSLIDNKLIACAQWMMRQIELFTQATRKDIGRFLFIVISCLGWTIVLLFLIIVHFDSPFPFLAFIGYLVSIDVAFLEFFFQKTIKHLIEKNNASTSLPQEIVTRSRIRLVRFHSLAINVFIFVVFLPMIKQNIESYDLFIKIFIPELVFLIIVEYFLCTTSLPPGEKERRQQEKEAQNLQPNPSAS